MISRIRSPGPPAAFFAVLGLLGAIGLAAWVTIFLNNASAQPAAATLYGLMINGNPIGPTVGPVNFQSGPCVMFTPSAGVNQTNVTVTINSACAPSYGLLYQDPYLCLSTNGTTLYGCTLNNFPGPPPFGMPLHLVADTTCAPACSVNPTAGTGTGYAITQADGATAPNGQIVAGRMAALWFDGRVFRML